MHDQYQIINRSADLTKGILKKKLLNNL